jgi:hypothetical protein
MGTGFFPGIKWPQLVPDFPSHLWMSFAVVRSFVFVSPLCLYEHLMGRPLPSNIYFVYRNAVRLSHGVQFGSVTTTNQLMMSDEVVAVGLVSQRKAGKYVLKIQRFRRQTWRYRERQLAFTRLSFLEP